MNKNNFSPKDMYNYMFNKFGLEHYDISSAMASRNKMMKVISELDSVLMKLKNVQE